MSNSTLRRRRLMPAAPATAAREMESRGYKPSATPMYGPGLGYDGFYGAPWGGAREFDGYSFVAGQSARVALSRGTLQ
jgi:hypothetical protein